MQYFYGPLVSVDSLVAIMIAHIFHVAVLQALRILCLTDSVGSLDGFRVVYNEGLVRRCGKYA